MKLQNNMTKTLLLTLTLSSSLLIGCAKEKPFDTVYKEVEQLQKNQFVVEENGKPVEYLYVPMTLGTPMEVADARPFYQGDEKVVRLNWAEEGLEVLQIERDERFTDNELNEKPVITIPGTYKAFHCREDAYGECTNAEEENNELEWFQKDRFTPDFEKLEVRELNSLDVLAVQGGSCVSKESTRLVDYEISNGVINVELEKSYRTNSSNIFCFIRSWYSGNLNQNSFKVKFFYSLVRLDKLKSKNYEPVAYPIPDHSDFGFFKGEELVLNDEFDSQRKDRKTLMNRWNPKKATLDYYLSPEYSKPENSLILKATYDAINSMNSEMSNNDIPLKIKLIEQPNPKTATSPGDLRYSSLVLIEDPLANGLLGYGPSVANPYTGEIVQAHTNMYLGVLKGMTRRVYDSARDLTIEEARGTEELETISNIKIDLESTLTNVPNSFIRKYESIYQDVTHTQEVQDDAQVDIATQDLNPSQIQKLNGSNKLHNLGLISNNEIHHHVSNAETVAKIEHSIHESMHAQIDHESYAISILELENRIERVQSTGSEEEGHLVSELNEKLKHLKHDQRLHELAKNSAFAEEFFPIAGTSKIVFPALKDIPEILDENGQLKDWTKLNALQKKEAQNIILVNTYTATLVHELGHNLGLRHNFTGSFDQDNFYSKEDAQARGMNDAPAYSSIMDYGFSQFNQLMALGKYDIAALRFGYARQVEMSDGSIQNVEVPIEEKIKDMDSLEAISFLTKKPLTDFATLSTQEMSANVTALLDQRKGEMVPATLKEFTDFSEKSNKSLKPYMFCTDENAGLSPTCNRFDEGSNLVEITKHLIKRYEDYYKYRNFRDGRLSFSAYGVPSYVYYRSREFGRIRDVFEEFERFTSFFDVELMLQGCSAQQLQNPEIRNTCLMINDRRDSAKLVSEFFMKLIKTPDHLCAVGKADQPNVVTKYVKLYDLYDDNKFSLPQGYYPKSCYDKELTASFEAGEILIGENGKYLNGFKDTDPNYRYVSDRAVRGIWADKIMAMRFLFKRRWSNSTTDEEHMALMDLPYVKTEADEIFNHMILGNPLETGNPFKNDKGQQFTIPYAIGADYKVNQLEDTFWYLRRYYGMPANGQASFFRMNMAQIDRFGIGYGDKYEDAAIETNNIPAVHRFVGVFPENERTDYEKYYFDRKTRTTYFSDESTPYADRIITALSEVEFLAQFTKEEVEEAALHKLNPPMPDSLTEKQAAFWEIQAATQDQLISLADQGAELNEEVVIRNFGPVAGPLIIEIYNDGADSMEEVLLIKNEVANTAPIADATTEQKRLYTLPISILADYVTDNLSDEVLEFYKDNLRNMPEANISYR